MSKLMDSKHGAGRRLVPPRWVIWLWPLLDRLLSRKQGIQLLREGEPGALRIQLRRHQGPPVTLRDNCLIQPGDPIIELHLDSAWFTRRKKMPASSRLGWEYIQASAQDLAHLAELLSQGKLAPEAKALHGLTFVHAGGRRLGFEVREVPPGLRKRATHFFLSGLMQLNYPPGGDRLKMGQTPLELKEVWFSRSQFLARYGSARSGGAQRIAPVPENKEPS